MEKSKNFNSINPLFSIIIPIYNVSGCIALTLKSILLQTFTNFEVLAIDDGSTDNSGIIVDKIAANDPRIRVFHQANAGVSAARNLGLDNARGEWIVFVDGDDALRKNALQSISDCIRRNPTVDLISYQSIHTKDIKYTDIEDNCIEISDTERIIDCSSYVPFTLLNHYVVWSETFRRDILGDLRFEPLRNGEDVLFCNGIGFRANNYLNLNEQLYIYRLLRRGGAYSNKWSQQVYNDYYMSQKGILRNILMTQKKIDQLWVKRWIGGLLYYRSELKQFNKVTKSRCFKDYRFFLLDVAKLNVLPNYQKIWIKIATVFNSYRYFYITAMMPMRLYSKLRQII